MRDQRPVPADLLFAAVRDFAQAVAGAEAVEVSLRLDDGTELRLTVPRRRRREERREVEVGEDDEPLAWSFSGRFASYNGTRFEVGGKQRAVLELLASEPGEWFTLDRLRRECWPKHGADDRTISNAVSQLRATLRRAIPVDTDPVETDGGNYRLFLT